MEKSHFISMGLTELLGELYTNENVLFGDLDIYNHISDQLKLKNRGLNYIRSVLVMMYLDILKFLRYKTCLMYKGDVYPLWCFEEKYKDSSLWKGDLENINFGGWTGINIEEDVFEQYLGLVESLLANNDDMDYEPGTSFGYIEDYIRVLNIFLDEKNKIISSDYINEKLKIEIDRKHSKNRQPLTFRGLFKDEYLDKMPLFYSRLRANGFIDNKNVWRETADKNEPAKVYFWLLDKGVMKTANDATNALICFYKEFGITAYKDTEPTPPADVRKTVTKNLLKVKGKNTPDEKKRFEQVFLPYLIKQLVP